MCHNSNRSRPSRCSYSSSSSSSNRATCLMSHLVRALLSRIRIISFKLILINITKTILKKATLPLPKKSALINSNSRLLSVMLRTHFQSSCWLNQCVTRSNKLLVIGSTLEALRTAKISNCILPSISNTKTLREEQGNNSSLLPISHQLPNKFA